MTYVIFLDPNHGLGPTGGYVLKRGGTNSLVTNPDAASKYGTKQEASETGKVGHHADMGGTGFKGRVVALGGARTSYLESLKRKRRW